MTISSDKNQRKQREAAALRENLLKRKQQARTRAQIRDIPSVSTAADDTSIDKVQCSPKVFLKSDPTNE